MQPQIIHVASYTDINPRQITITSPALLPPQSDPSYSSPNLRISDAYSEMRDNNFISFNNFVST